MSRRTAWLFLLLACGLAGCGRRDEGQIRAVLREMERVATFSARPSLLDAAAKAKELGAFFTPEVRFGQNVVPVTIDDRGALESAALYARTELDRFSVELEEEDLAVDRAAATARMRVVAKGSLTMMGETDRVWRELEIDWQKTNGTWKIARIQVIEAIRQPP